MIAQWSHYCATWRAIGIWVKRDAAEGLSRRALARMFDSWHPGPYSHALSPTKIRGHAFTTRCMAECTGDAHPEFDGICPKVLYVAPRHARRVVGDAIAGCLPLRDLEVDRLRRVRGLAPGSWE